MEMGATVVAPKYKYPETILHQTRSKLHEKRKQKGVLFDFAREKQVNVRVIPTSAAIAEVGRAGACIFQSCASEGRARIPKGWDVR